ncbi:MULTISPECIES: hypothetical protein [Methylobacterium]|uniref:hypothetical protein n=1 Tax=Methylobacterium TaxID=407 RepID=UPI0013EB64C4|nr:hypothetical protein [Methylobacterium sp. DB0501]NGM38255.1 hypothetical protein [Methylobacterium sp. DB0501]
MAPRRPASPSIIVTCLCGALATVRSEAGRWFCADHVPRRDTPPDTRPSKAPARREPAQRDLFRP